MPLFRKKKETKVEQELPDKKGILLGWLVDAPLFINPTLLEKFYDAVVRPENKEGKTVIEIGTEKNTRSKGNLALDAGGELSAGDLINKIANFFPSIKVSGKITGGGEREWNKKSNKKKTVELFSIENAERQLIHLAIYYLTKHPHRVLRIDELTTSSFSGIDVTNSPRNLVFLDLPARNNTRQVKIIPTAAEFSDNTIVELYKRFGGKTEQPESPDTAGKENYWKWFYENCTPYQAMKIVEDNIGGKGDGKEKGHGNIKWIDYRVLDKEGSLLHLHLVASEKYSSVDLAYNFVKRGSKHGLRIVGTLKSGPSMNVLAVFEK